jgi:hypothetical protein
MNVQCALNEATAAIPILRRVSVLIPQALILNFVESRATGSYVFVGSAERRARSSIRCLASFSRVGADTG